jgi:lipoprotein-anchoring transpeptidase ErfK/SrfK
MRRLLLCTIFISQFAYAADLAPNIANKLHDFFNQSTFEEEGVTTTVFSEVRKSELQNIFIFSPQEHTWAVYTKDGKRVGYGRATGGKDFCPDIKENCRTVEGKFQVFRKEDKGCTSKTFPIDEGGGAPMPYCMFFHKGYAIHGSKNVSDHNISHGCVRVSKKAAKWIHSNYIHEGSYVLVLPYEA